MVGVAAADGLVDGVDGSQIIAVIGVAAGVGDAGGQAVVLLCQPVCGLLRIEQALAAKPVKAQAGVGVAAGRAMRGSVTTVMIVNMLLTMALWGVISGARFGG